MQRHLSTSESAEAEKDGEASARLYQRHAPTILAYLRLHVSREEAEDLLLEVFLSALDHVETLQARSEETQRAWLRSVARHKLIDHYRRATHRAHIALEEVAETLYADEAQAPEQLALRHEEVMRVGALLTRLPHLQQQVVRLRFVYGLSCAEIAAVLEKKESAVRRMLTRALNSVRSLYTRE